jgi:hypothetical protein
MSGWALMSTELLRMMGVLVFSVLKNRVVLVVVVVVVVVLGLVEVVEGWAK